MKKGLLTIMIILFCAAQSQALIVNPRPDLFGADDGSELFEPCSCLLAVEGFDLFDKYNLGGSTFGFFFCGTDPNDPGNLIPVFEPDDVRVNGDRPKAAVDFINGIVRDMDEGGDIQNTFTPGTGNIGFFLQADPEKYDPIILFTVASLNLGGVDAAATFPHLMKANTYLIGFELPDAGITLAYEAIRGIAPVPVPEPETLILTGLGLFMMMLYAWKLRKGSWKKRHVG